LVGWPALYLNNPTTLMNLNPLRAGKPASHAADGYRTCVVSDTIDASIPRAIAPRAMQAYVYKSQRKQDTYVYLAARDAFDALPDALKATLAPFAFVLEVALTPHRRLALADVDQVRANLAERGFHLQMPPPPVAPVRVPRRDDPRGQDPRQDD